MLVKLKQNVCEIAEEEVIKALLWNDCEIDWNCVNESDYNSSLLIHLEHWNIDFFEQLIASDKWFISMF